MPRTPGTRPKGSGIPAGGAGWGGPAKGEGRPIQPGERLGVGRAQPGGGRRTVADLMADAGARELAAERWLAILNDPGHPKHAEMVAKAAERMDGAPTQRVEVREADPDTLTDEELAAIASRGRRASAGPAEDPG